MCKIQMRVRSTFVKNSSHKLYSNENIKVFNKLGLKEKTLVSFFIENQFQKRFKFLPARYFLCLKIIHGYRCGYIRAPSAVIETVLYVF